MAAIRHLRNAPITEALLDFRVKPVASSSEVLLASERELAGQFASVERITETRATIEIKDGNVLPPKKAEAFRGLMVKSDGGKTVVQLRTDGFTYSRLKPYTSWEEISPRAFDLWGEYVRRTAPQVVSRVAVRYINHLQLPGGRIDFDDYLTAGPEIPDELPQVFSNFLIRLVIHDEALGLVANVTQALEPPTNPRFTTVILDVDVYRVQDFSPDDPGLTETFERLREFKNRVFFNYVTEATTRLFE